MDRLHKSIGLTLSLLSLLADPAFGYYIIEGPQNLTILAGSDARFNCTVSEGWKIIIWLFDGNPKLSVLSNGAIIRTDNRYNQKGYNNSAEFTSELIIYGVQPDDSGQIKCSIQNEDDNKYAFLSVQVEPGKNEDWRTRTIILAVVLSVVGLLLLILIILLIICCCKRKKESNYRNELRKVSEKKPPDRNLETMSHSGKDNYGYSPEERKHAEEMTRDPTFFPVVSNIYGPKQDLNVSPPSEISSQISSSSQSLQRISPVLSLDHINQCSQKGTTQQSRRVLFRIASSRIHKPRSHQQLYSSKQHPHIQQSEGKYHHTSKLYPQRRQSIGQRAYTRRLAHQPEQPKAQVPQRPIHQNRKQLIYSRMQQKKSHHRQIQA